VALDDLVLEALMQPGEPGDLILGALLDRPSWMALGACRGAGVEFVPPPPRPGRTSAAEEAALAVCQRCPVIEECLAFALEHGEAGVWGGTTEAERREMRRAA
jgi:WhiB family redox-sensing transcriptional regulator